MFEQYPMLRVEDGRVLFRFDLASTFDEPMEMFSVDSTMVSDMFTLNTMFANDEIDAELITAVTDWLSDLFEYDPITTAGDFCMTFEDVRAWYGKSFDANMTELYPMDYPAFNDYFSE